MALCKNCTFSKMVTASTSEGMVYAFFCTKHNLYGESLENLQEVYTEESNKKCRSFKKEGLQNAS